MVHSQHAAKLGRRLVPIVASLSAFAVVAAVWQDPHGTWLRESPGPQNAAKVQTFARLIRATGNPGSQSGVNLERLVVRRNSVDGQYRLWDGRWYLYFWPGTDMPKDFWGLPAEEGGSPNLTTEQCRDRAMPLMHAAVPNVSFRVFHLETFFHKNTVRVGAATRLEGLPLEYMGGAWVEVDRATGRIVDSAFARKPEILGARGPFVAPAAARASMAHAAFRFAGWAEVEVECMDSTPRWTQPDTPVYSSLSRVRALRGPFWEYDPETLEASQSERFMPIYEGRVIEVGTGWDMYVVVQATSGRALVVFPFTSRALARKHTTPVPLPGITADDIEGDWSLVVGRKEFKGKLEVTNGVLDESAKRVMLLRGTRAILAEFHSKRNVVFIRMGDAVHAYRPTGELLLGLRKAEGLQPKSFGESLKGDSGATQAPM